MQKRGFHPTFLLFERLCFAEKNFAYSAARKVSSLMLINCLINSEQIVNNSCSRKQFVFQTKSIRAPQKMKAALMNPFMSILGEKRGKSAPKKPTILSVFSAIRH